MGKTRKPRGGRAANKQQQQQPNGVDLLSSLAGSELATAAEPATPEETIRAVADTLSRGSENDKVTGLHSLALLCSSGKLSGPDALTASALRVVAPLMLEPGSLPIRQAAVGAAKNLSLVGADACDDMVKQDVMTPVTALFNKYFSDPETAFKAEPVPQKKSSKKAAADDGMEVEENGDAAARENMEKQETPAELFIQAVDLLWNLCEANSTALEIANKENLIQLLVKHLQYVCGEYVDPEQVAVRRVKLALLQCLYTATEDNQVAAAAVAQKLDLFRALFSSDDSCQVRVLAVGV